MKEFLPNDTNLMTPEIRIIREWNAARQRWEVTIKNIPGFDGDVFFSSENCPRLIIS